MSTIIVDETKCVGCNSCVRVCSVEDANIANVNSAGQIVIKIDEQKCIKCGACIKACVHGARNYQDDTEAFFDALEANEELALIVAPSIKLVFEDRWASLLTWFRKRGVSIICDVSLGADICTWAHLRYLKQNPSAKIISQPCAAIVNYALKHRHELVDKLSPVNSPMLCTAIYMRKYKKYDGKIAAISPCIAKKDEFIQTGSLINYNVTLKKLDEYLEKHGVNYKNLASRNEFTFDAGSGFLGGVYPKPGGLKENLLLHEPELSVINSEGISKVYGELDQYLLANTQDVPAVFDVLNCEFGCNEGPGIGKAYDIFRMNSSISEVGTAMLKAEKQNRNKRGEDLQFAEFDRELNLDSFLRDYSLENLNEKNVSEIEIRHSFEKLHKKTFSEMNFDCHSCGYKSCRKMAEAIARGVNVPENCRRYNVYMFKQEKEHIDNINSEFFAMAHEMEDIIIMLSNSIETVENQVRYIADSGVKSTESMNKVAAYMDQLNDMNEKIISLMKVIDGNIENYSEMTNSVRAIAGKINLLSLNASIESARAGEAGRAFAVVATNIRNLSESSKRSVENAEENEESIRNSIENVSTTVDNFSRNFGQLIEMIDVAKENVNLVTERSTMISDSMEKLNSISKKLEELVERTAVIIG